MIGSAGCGKQEALSAATIALEISIPNARVAALQSAGIACAPASS
jgi:hypothetical protein